MASREHGSVENFAKCRLAFLASVQATPEKYAKFSHLVGSLKTQGTFAALKIEEENVLPCSLNTLKKSASLVLDGGFKELDDLRNAVVEALQRISSAELARPDTKADLRRRLDEANKRTKQLEEDLWQVTRAFYKAMTNARSYANESNDEAIRHRCSIDERELRSMLSLAKTKFITTQRRSDNER
ncbi:MAG: hypothetical protein V4807_18100 [Burkholderia gladioli]|uniref:hypothetical protein n=1 Tax=Burkholderia lata (strain ATCC 17760 / DSM 23089 / LMG 22485 / NCIMB 9086 / R18194 / 383) TaxID=482957 RepID=UPI0015842CC5|nr:hypothetical protein [Burkholderia lata]